LGEQPPSSASKRLIAGDEYPQNFTFFFSQAGNSFTAYFVPTIFVDKPYNTLFVKEMKFEWESKTEILLKDTSFNMPVNSYISQNDWYWVCGIGDFYSVKFEKLFKGKKPGDEFIVKLTLVYSFDDEPEKIQVLEYEVTALKNEYTSIFMGW